MNKNSFGDRYGAVIGALVLAVFSTVFVWRFWEYGVSAVGINISILWFGILALFVFVVRCDLRKDALWWLVPVGLMIASLGIYSNWFTSWITALILPLVFFIFATHQAHAKYRATLWSKVFPVAVIVAFLRYLGSVRGIASARLLPQSDIGGKLRKNDTVRQIVFGLGALGVLAFFVVVPLLSAADAQFAQILDNIIIKITEIFSFDGFARIAVTFLIAVGLIALVRYWRRDMKSFAQNSSGDASLRKNSIAIGVVLGGILALYLLYILIQIKALFVGSLPINFADTEMMVKTGFWQLFLLTMFNVALYTYIYNSRTRAIGYVLTVFTLASLLLIVSAAHRVWLYVVNYGLSYEKFFAIYTVVFCLVVFVWFLVLLLRKTKSVAIIKTLAFGALWAYALVVIMPLERIIFDVNMNLTKQEDSRVNVNELQMLGYDALRVVEARFDELLAEAQKDGKASSRVAYGAIKSHNVNADEQLRKNVLESWDKWTQKTLRKQDSLLRYYATVKLEKEEEYRKRWYEKTLTELMYKPKTKVNSVEKLPVKAEIASLVTWANPVHGFAITYPASFSMDDNDSDNLRKLHDRRYKMTIKGDDGDGRIVVEFYSDLDPTPSNKHRGYIDLITKFKTANKSKITLPKMPEVEVYSIQKDFKSKSKSKSNKYQTGGLLMKLPTGIMIVFTDKNIPANQSVTIQGYIDSISLDEQFAQIIKSLELVEVTTNFKQ